MKKITIVLRPSETNDIKKISKKLYKYLIDRKLIPQFLNQEKERLKNYFQKKEYDKIIFIKDNLLYKSSDLIISLGGDGTLIGICRKAKGSKTPIFGVNLGNLGFITEFTTEEMFKHLNQVLNNKFEVTRGHLYKAQIIKDDKITHEDLFFNDAVISNNKISRIISLDVFADEHHVLTSSGDGMIISSTVGSTAYSLAAGGPLVHPNVKAMILTPICSHGLTNRPLVVPNNAEILVKLSERTNEATLTLDGQSVFSITQSESVKIIKDSKNSFYMINNKNRIYYDVLKDKFVYGRRDAYANN